jgi:hypothetical protein
LTPSVWRMAALPKIVEEIVSGVLWFSNFSISCGHCWWKFYCEQLCSNAVNYPSTPLTTSLYSFTPHDSMKIEYDTDLEFLSQTRKNVSNFRVIWELFIYSHTMNNNKFYQQILSIVFSKKCRVEEKPIDRISMDDIIFYKVVQFCYVWHSLTKLFLVFETTWSWMGVRAVLAFGSTTISF